MAQRPHPHYPSGPSAQTMGYTRQMDGQQGGGLSNSAQDGMQRMQLHSAGRLFHVLGS